MEHHHGLSGEAGQLRDLFLQFFRELDVFELVPEALLGLGGPAGLGDLALDRFELFVHLRERLLRGRYLDRYRGKLLLKFGHLFGVVVRLAQGFRERALEARLLGLKGRQVTLQL